jgi:uncharacterized protein YueI
VVSMTDPYGRILAFLDRSHYFFFQVAPQLYSRSEIVSSWTQATEFSLVLSSETKMQLHQMKPIQLCAALGG